MDSNLKPVIAGFLIGIIIIILVFGISNWDIGRSYTINDGIVNVTINEDGLVHVSESYVYDFDGTYNGVKRNIPLKSDETIRNLKIYTENAYATYYTDYDYYDYNITTYLYANSEKTEKIHDTEVTVIYDYDMSGVVKYSDDNKALFNFKLKGGEWDKPINGFTAYINYPSQEDITYYINPYEYNATSTTWNGSTLEVSTDDSISTYLEINSLIPKNQFNSMDNASFHNENYETRVIREETNYISEYQFGSTYYPIMILLLVLSLIIPVGIYYKYGREPEVDYNAIYERTPPTNDSPAFVNAMGSRSKIRDVGKIDDDAFKATIMDLIDRKYLSLIHSEDKNIKIKIGDKNLNDLKDFEIDAINLIREFEVNGIIDFDYMSSELKVETTARDYINSLNRWKSNFQDNYLSDEVMSKYFDNKGGRLLKYYSIIIIVLSVMFMIIAIFNSAAIFLAEILVITSIIMIILVLILKFGISNSIWGRWTDYGKEYNDKWNNFKKYLSDFSLMEEHPPESVSIWNKYLVYATSIGAAASVSAAMSKLVYANTQHYNNDAYTFYYLGGYNSFSDAISTGYSTVSSSNSSSGGVGGGSGGGGGGAF